MVALDRLARTACRKNARRFARRGRDTWPINESWGTALSPCRGNRPMRAPALRISPRPRRVPAVAELSAAQVLCRLGQGGLPGRTLGLDAYALCSALPNRQLREHRSSRRAGSRWSDHGHLRSTLPDGCGGPVSRQRSRETFHSAATGNGLPASTRAGCKTRRSSGGTVRSVRKADIDSPPTTTAPRPR